MLTRTVRKTTIALMLLFALAVNVGVSQAQVVPVTASVDRTTLSTDEILTLTVTIVGETNVPLPVLPHIDGAQIIGRSTASQITITNGKATAEFNFDFRLQPLREGLLTIDPIKVVIRGVEHETDPIEVSIVRGSGRRGGVTTPPTPTSRRLVGQDYFIDAEVDNETPYLGEQVIFTVSFYESGGFAGRQRYRPPDFTGFWNAQNAQRRTYSTLTAGRRYTVTELKSVLFPTVVGDVVIEPAIMDVATIFFRSSRTPYASASIPMTVKPLPPGAPASFTGAVGSYEISASVDTNYVSSSDPVTLTVVLSGQGNLDALPEPAWPDMPAWRVFDNRAETATFISDDKLSGTRTYQRVLIPEFTGFLDVPPIEYAYFDPTEERYLVVSTEPITVTVSLDAAASANNFTSAPAKLDVNRVESDIRHIRASESSLDVRSAPLTSRRLYWALWALPATLLVASAAWGFRQRALSGHGAVDPATLARDAALTALHGARQSGSDPFVASGDALIAYISARINRPASGLTHHEVSALLTQADISSSLVQEIDALLNLTQDGRYSPAQMGESAEPVLDQAERLIDELEWEFEQ